MQSLAAHMQSPSPGLMGRMAEMVSSINPFFNGKSKSEDPKFAEWGRYRHTMLPADQRLAPPVPEPTKEDKDHDPEQPALANSLNGVLDFKSHKLFRDYRFNPVQVDDDVQDTARALFAMERQQGGLAFSV